MLWAVMGWLEKNEKNEKIKEKKTFSKKTYSKEASSQTFIWRSSQKREHYSWKCPQCMVDLIRNRVDEHL